MLIHHSATPPDWFIHITFAAMTFLSNLHNNSEQILHILLVISEKLENSEPNGKYSPFSSWNYQYNQLRIPFPLYAYEINFKAMLDPTPFNFPILYKEQIVNYNGPPLAYCYIDDQFEKNWTR